MLSSILGMRLCASVRKLTIAAEANNVSVYNIHGSYTITILLPSPINASDDSFFWCFLQSI